MPSSILRVHGLAMLLDKLSVFDYLKPTSEGTYSLYVSRTPYLADSFVSVLHPATTRPWPSKCCSLPIQKQCCTISPETVFHSIARKCIALSVVHHHSYWMNSREGNVTSGKLDMALWELNRTVLRERKSWNNVTNRKASPRFYCF